MGSPSSPTKVESDVVVVDATAEPELDTKEVSKLVSKEVSKLDSKEAPKQEKEVAETESKEPLNETPKKKKPLWKSAVDHASASITPIVHTHRLTHGRRARIHENLLIFGECTKY